MRHLHFGKSITALLSLIFNKVVTNPFNSPRALDSYNSSSSAIVFVHKQPFTGSRAKRNHSRRTDFDYFILFTRFFAAQTTRPLPKGDERSTLLFFGVNQLLSLFTGFGVWNKLRTAYYINNWVYTTNHKRIAVNYFWFVILSGIVGMVLATVMRLEFAYPGVGVFAGDSIQYLTLASAHGVIMVFFMIMPLLFGAFANFLIPTQLGVHDVAFPRLNSAAFWFLPGGLLMLCQLVCVDRRYQRMNCFNIREVQSLLKRRFFADLLNAHDSHTLLDSTAIGLRFKLNNGSLISSNFSLFVNYGLRFDATVRGSVLSRTSARAKNRFTLLTPSSALLTDLFKQTSALMEINSIFLAALPRLSLELILCTPALRVFIDVFNAPQPLAYVANLLDIRQFIETPNLSALTLHSPFSLFCEYLSMFFDALDVLACNCEIISEGYLPLYYDIKFELYDFFDTPLRIHLGLSPFPGFDSLFARFSAFLLSVVERTVLSPFNNLFVGLRDTAELTLADDNAFKALALIYERAAALFVKTLSFINICVNTAQVLFVDDKGLLRPFGTFFDLLLAPSRSFSRQVLLSTAHYSYIAQLEFYRAYFASSAWIFYESLAPRLTSFYGVVASDSRTILAANVDRFKPTIWAALTDASFIYFDFTARLLFYTPVPTLATVGQALSNNTLWFKAWANCDLFYEIKLFETACTELLRSVSIFGAIVTPLLRFCAECLLALYHYFSASALFEKSFSALFPQDAAFSGLEVSADFFAAMRNLPIFSWALAQRPTLLVLFGAEPFCLFNFSQNFFITELLAPARTAPVSTNPTYFTLFSKYFVTWSALDLNLLANTESAGNSRFKRAENPVFRYDYKAGDYFPKLNKEVYPYLFSTILSLTSGLRMSSWFFSPNFTEVFTAPFAAATEGARVLPAGAFTAPLASRLPENSLNKIFPTSAFVNFFQNCDLAGAPNAQWVAVSGLNQKFYKLFTTSSMQQRVFANWRQLKFSREAWRCKLLTARHQKTLFKRYLNEDGVFWSIERNAKDLIPGWAMITPFSSRTRFTAIGKTDIGLMGVLLVLNSSIISGANFLVTYRYLSTLNNRKIRDARAFFTEAVIVASWMMILANPMLAIGIIMLLSDRHWQTSFFDYSGGGDTVLFQHMFWFFGHPEVYVIIIPTFGFTNTTLSFYLRKRVSARASLLYSMYTIAFLGFFVWGHHMYMVGLAHTTRMLFSTLTVMISVPAATKIMHWCVTTVNSAFVMELPLLFTFTFIFFFVSGGISGMCVAHTGMDILFHDTFYVIGHFHVMLAGGAMFASFGAFYFYFSAIFGVKFSRIYAYLHYTYYLVGQLMTVIPMFWLGYAGMPRRVLDYPSSFGGWHSVISAGHMLNVAGLMAFFIMIFDSLRQTRAATRNTFGINRYNTRLNFYLYEIAKINYVDQKASFLGKNYVMYVRPRGNLATVPFNHEVYETTLFSYVFSKATR